MSWKNIIKQSLIIGDHIIIPIGIIMSIFIMIYPYILEKDAEYYFSINSNVFYQEALFGTIKYFPIIIFLYLLFSWNRNRNIETMQNTKLLVLFAVIINIIFMFILLCIGYDNLYSNKKSYEIIRKIDSDEQLEGEGNVLVGITHAKNDVLIMQGEIASDNTLIIRGGKYSIEPNTKYKYTYRTFKEVKCEKDID